MNMQKKKKKKHPKPTYSSKQHALNSFSFKSHSELLMLLLYINVTQYSLLENGLIISLWNLKPA